MKITDETETWVNNQQKDTYDKHGRLRKRIWPSKRHKNGCMI